MSLGSWFRDYVYIPMGGSRVKKGRMFFNIFTVWMLTGFWHGAAWNFIIWGLYFAILLLVEKTFVLIIAAVCVAFAVAFGIGGRNFAANMLAKLEKKIDNNEETK